MPRLGERGINPLTAPGIVPGVLSVALLVLGLVLALRRHDLTRARLGLDAILGVGTGRRNLGITLGLNSAFALVLVGLAPFWLAVLLYLAIFMGIFGLPEARRGALGKRAALILVVSAAMTAGIVYLFGSLFFVRLP
jgi:putative tricarboxylic transport membrane protein